MGDGGGPDEAWVFDEKFVAGGMSEDAARRAAGRTYATRRPTGPVNSLGNAPGPRDWTPPPPRSARRSAWRGGLLIVAALAAIVGVVLLGAQGTSGNQPSPIVLNAPPVDTSSSGSGSAHGEAEAHGITPETPRGTCLAGRAPANGEVRVRPVACSISHDFQLVRTERAAGDGAYPADDYWDGPVARRCYHDLLHYTGRRRDRWPTGLDSTWFQPTRRGWDGGDRTVYCLAALHPARAGTVRDLPAARRVVIPVRTPTPAVSTSVPSMTEITGKLTVVVTPASNCLGIRTHGGRVSLIVSGVPGLSWLASTDATGAVIASRSGIAAGGDPRRGSLRWHAGDRVTLDAVTLIDDGTPCSGGYAFSAVRSAP